MDIIESALRQGFGADAIIFALAAIGLNIHFGYTGLLNFGQAAFMAMGGYGLAAMVSTFGYPFWVGIVVGFGATIVLALLLGVPTLRLRADYLAIVTIAAAEIIRLTVGSVTLREWFGGRDGLQAFTETFRSYNPFDGPTGVGFLTYRAYDAWVILVGWILVALCVLLTWALMRSPWGRVLKSIREDEDAVRSLGKNVYGYKMQSLVLGGLIGCLAGFMTALRQSATNPDDYFTEVTFFAYTVLILGGAARVLGPVVGSIIFWFLINALGGFFDEATSGPDPLIPASIMTDNQASLVRFIVMGLALMLLMIFRPQGILGDRKELALDAR
jgi:ABC-type branched-subunit amino acid transport system permease subunit